METAWAQCTADWYNNVRFFFQHKHSMLSVCYPADTLTAYRCIMGRGEGATTPHPLIIFGEHPAFLKNLT